MTERQLPDRRATTRQKFRIAEASVYLDLGLYDDGRLGELFIVVEKTGDERRWYYDEIARLGSKLLQHGCPIDELAQGWVGTRGRICGPVQGHPRIKHCTSVLDFVGRLLLVEYCQREDLAHVKEGA